LLAPGHVCTVTGFKWCEDVSSKYNLPVIVTGFEPVDILEAIHSAIERIYGKNPGVVNQYRRVVRREGNNEAFNKIKQVFKVCSRNWRGLGSIPFSGYNLKEEFEEYDALRKFNIELIPEVKDNGCMAGEILQGKRKPEECNLFGTDCHPGNPKGAPMVSSEGTCAAYFRYRRTGNE
jgi:hydrogenase expression/formation protein HypD